MSAPRIFVPGDSGALAAGADRVAAALLAQAQRRGIAIAMVRNGSRGLYWLEPLVEVETPQGRVAYGPVAPGDAGSLFDADFLDGGAHALRLGLTENLDAL